MLKAEARKKYSEALDCLKKALALKPNNDALLTTIKVLENKLKIEGDVAMRTSAAPKGKAQKEFIEKRQSTKEDEEPFIVKPSKKEDDFFLGASPKVEEDDFLGLEKKQHHKDQFIPTSRNNKSNEHFVTSQENKDDDDFLGISNLKKALALKPNNDALLTTIKVLENKLKIEGDVAMRTSAAPKGKAQKEFIEKRQSTKEDEEPFIEKPSKKEDDFFLGASPRWKKMIS
jgi:tetratricopeptide (TPR) repeat protein